MIVPDTTFHVNICELIIQNTAFQINRNRYSQIAAEVNRALDQRLEQAEGDAEAEEPTVGVVQSLATQAPTRSAELDEAQRSATKAAEELRKATEQLQRMRTEAEKLRKENEDINAKKAQEALLANQQSQQQQQAIAQHAAQLAQLQQGAALAAEKKRLDDEAARVEHVRIADIVINPVDLPDPTDLDLEDLKVLAAAHSLMEKVKQHYATVDITYEDTSLSHELLAKILGPLYTALYCDSNGNPIQVPQRIPKKILGVLGIALAKATAKLAKEAADDLKSVDEDIEDRFAAIIDTTMSRDKQKPY